MDEKRMGELLAIYKEKENVPNCLRCGRKFRGSDQRHIFTKDGVLLAGPVCSGCEADTMEEAWGEFLP